MKQQTFLKGAVILMAASFFNRILGFILRVVMVHYLGDEGVGLYSMIYPIYVTLVLLCTAGFPVAIAKLVSEKNAQGDVHGVKRILRLAITFVIITSITIAGILLLSAEWVAKSILSDLRTYYLILAISPALIFVSIASVLRSYFQGLHTMTPTAISQMIEQLVRITASIFLIILLINKGLKYGAAGAAIGITLGEFSGMMTLIILYISHCFSGRSTDLLLRNLKTAPPSSYSYKQIFKDLCKMGIPITLGRLIISLMYSLDAILIPTQLQRSGLSVAEATSQFGQLSGIALQVIFLPTIISVALTTSLVPTISDALARNNMQAIRAKYHEVLRITFYTGMPATLFFIFRGRQICYLLFDFAEAGSLLALLGVGAISTYFIHVAGGILNGLGKPHLAVKNMIIGAAFKIIGLLTLVSHPLLGIRGAAISIVTGWITGSIADFISLGRIVGFKLNLYHLVIKPFFGCLVLYWLLPIFDNAGKILGLNPKSVTLLTIFLSSIFYFIWMILVKGISKDDLKKFK
ncbi:stage V sporulation protein B [Anoxybacter fermentans]|uniref:Stage V sporulation protein B n=1 Tax=Anoxybacter fermentans TaxID=1323375 RepID=A0A3Q9HTN8_9FIRM|nr:stage V sporulation protein B [Anoxybacter fermentans]AZR74163.1 stage V sporulation protein B [Anoxybacter fermentans]